MEGGVQTVAIRGGSITLSCKTYGERAGEPLVMIHGLGAQGVVQWNSELLSLLVEAGFFVITFDNRDVGKSTLLTGSPPPSELVTGLQERFNSYLPTLFELASFLLLSKTVEVKEPMTKLLRAALLLCVVGFQTQIQEQFSFDLTQTETPYQLTDMAEDVALLLSELGIDSAHMLGVSMGGMIAQTFCIEYPDRARSLCSIMSCPGPGNGPFTPSLEYYAGFLKNSRLTNAESTFDERVEAKVISKRYNSNLKHFDADREREDAKRIIAREPTPALAKPGKSRQTGAIFAAPDRTPQLAQLKIPTLIIHGMEDPLVRPENAEYLAEALPESKLVLFEEMGHELPPRLVQRIAEHIIAHLRGTSAAAPKSRL